MNKVEDAVAKQLKTDVPEFGPGDTIAVHVKVTEGDKTREQIFKGVCLQRRGSGINETFTVRKVSHSVGVERIFPLHSPSVVKIVREKRGRVRRAKLYYLRERVGKAARIQELR